MRVADSGQNVLLFRSILDEETVVPELVTHAELLSILSYESATGFFVWRRAPGKNIRAGARAGTVGANGHRIIGINFRDYTAQRLAWFYAHGKWPTAKLKHLDGRNDNNAIANLAEVNGSGRFKGEFDCSTPEGKAAYGRAHRRTNPELYQERYLKRDFDMTLAEYTKMLTVQKGVCAICHQPETAVRNGKLKHLAVDHDHAAEVATGQIRVRGLLCGRCNPMIGYAQDNPDVLEAAAAYLRGHAAEVLPFRKDSA
jgi:Recombination endonuclease VII/HNH endonuclease